jgi:hypothetical protein
MLYSALLDFNRAIMEIEMSANQPWKTGRLKSALCTTEKMLKFLGVNYHVCNSNGSFSIDLGEPTELQYLSTTGMWGFYTDKPGKKRFPNPYEVASTPKRFYEGVLSSYIDFAPPWAEVREALK